MEDHYMEDHYLARDKYMARDKCMMAAALFFLLIMCVRFIIQIEVLNKKAREAIRREALNDMQEEIDVKDINVRLNGLQAYTQAMGTDIFYIKNVPGKGSRAR